MLAQNYFVDPKLSIEETLKQMNRLETLALNNLDFNQFVGKYFYPMRSCVDCLLLKLWKSVVKNFNYVSDDMNDRRGSLLQNYPDELIIAPYVLLDTREGDCEDFSLFIKSVLTLCKIPSQYFLMGRTAKGYSHITTIANGKVLDGANGKYNFVKPDYKFFATA